jgi:hypothetical protein
MLAFPTASLESESLFVDCSVRQSLQSSQAIHGEWFSEGLLLLVSETGKLERPYAARLSWRQVEATRRGQCSMHLSLLFFPEALGPGAESC